FREGLRHVLKIAEVDVIALTLPGQKSVQRMMKVIVPLRVESVSAQLRWTNHARVIQRAFGDDIRAAIERPALFVDCFGKLFEKVQCGVIENRMDGIETKGIDMVAGNPFE